MTTQQIIENAQRLELQQHFASALKSKAAKDSRLNTDQITGYTAGALLCGQNLCSFTSDNTNMLIYFCKQGELQARRDYPDMHVQSVPINGSMCWQDLSGTQYSSEELAQYCCDRLFRAG
jgi:hypothetical protein